MMFFPVMNGNLDLGGPEILFLILLVAGILAGFIALFVYIYGDARRRNMNAALWTLLAIFAPSGIGIILYFLLREPLAAHCTKCGSPADARFAFCPRCGAGLTPACPQCHRVPQTGWSHCAHCGARL
jgi:hypothetical protein